MILTKYTVFKNGTIKSVIFLSIQEVQQHQLYRWVGNCVIYLRSVLITQQPFVQLCVYMLNVVNTELVQW